MKKLQASTAVISALKYMTFTLVCTAVSLLVAAHHANATTTEPAVMATQTIGSQDLKKELREEWGIELTALRMTAANHMVDFRYRVLDADKAMPLFKRQTKPYLVHQASGKVLAVPNTAKVGSLRNSNTPREGKIYWMFFGNNGVVQKGDTVSVVIGDFKAGDLTVE